MASEFPNQPGGIPPQPPIQPTPPPPPPPGAPMGGMIGRIQRILLSPVTEWAAIDREPMNAKALFLTWAVPLAAIGPICLLLGWLLFVGSFFINYAITLALVTYALNLGGTWAFAVIINELAPNFGSTKNFDQAMKTVCFSYTAAWLGAVFNIIPQIAIIGALLGIYSLYLLWIGMPLLMKTPADKAPPYVIVSIVVAVVVFIIIGVLARALVGAIVPFGYPGVGFI